MLIENCERSAKRYERLLKAHGVPTGGGNRANTPAAGSAGPAGALKAGPKRGAAAAKKRKTAPSPDTDDEEDVKLNLNSEAEKDTKKGVKKAAKKVTKTKKEKAEVAGDDDGSSILNTIPEAPQVGEGGGDDDLCLLCTAEQANGYVPAAVDNGGASQPANPIAGIHSFDYAANMNFHPQTMIPASDGPKLNYTGSPWLPHAESQHFYWNMVQHETSENGHQA